jgi:hypothetical protein
VIAAARRILFAVSWLVALAVLALGSAGLVAQWSHPPGTPARAELTWAGDRAVATSLDAAQADLEAIAGDVDRLALLARGALAAITADDQAPFVAALSEGRDLSRTIEAASSSLSGDLAILPGGSAADAIAHGAETLARRSAMVAALDSTGGLARSWAELTAGSLAASQLISLLASHDRTVAEAAVEGRAARYEAALAILSRATAQLDAATAIRDQLVNTSDVATLDAWLGRNRRYDTALAALYGAFRDSGGIVTDAVREAFREEGAARETLPPDTRGLVLIVADIGRGGLNQAVIAIEQARGRLGLALAAMAPPGNGPS